MVQMASGQAESTNAKGKKMNAGEGKFLKSPPVDEPDEDVSKEVGNTENECVVRITCDENNKGGEDTKKGILKHARTDSNKHVDFNMDVEFVPFDETKDFTIEIQIVEQMPKKVVSYAALFAEQKAKEEAEERAKEEAEQKAKKEAEIQAKKKDTHKKVSKEPSISKQINAKGHQTSNSETLKIEENSREINKNNEEANEECHQPSEEDLAKPHSEISETVGEDGIEVSKDIAAGVSEENAAEIRTGISNGASEENIEISKEISTGACEENSGKLVKENATEESEIGFKEEVNEYPSKPMEKDEADANEESKSAIQKTADTINDSDITKLNPSSENFLGNEELPKLVVEADLNESKGPIVTLKHHTQDTNKLQIVDNPNGEERDTERLSDDEYLDAHSWSEDYNEETNLESNVKHRIHSQEGKDVKTEIKTEMPQCVNKNATDDNIGKPSSKNEHEMECKEHPNLICSVAEVAKDAPSNSSMMDVSKCPSENKVQDCVAISSTQSPSPAAAVEGITSAPLSGITDLRQQEVICDQLEVTNSTEIDKHQENNKNFRVVDKICSSSTASGKREVIENSVKCPDNDISEFNQFKEAHQDTETQATDQFNSKVRNNVVENTEIKNLNNSSIDNSTFADTNQLVIENVDNENSCTRNKEEFIETTTENNSQTKSEISNEQSKENDAKFTNLVLKQIDTEKLGRDSGENAGELNTQGEDNNVEEEKFKNRVEDCELVSKLRNVCEIDNQRVTERLSELP